MQFLCKFEPIKADISKVMISAVLLYFPNNINWIPMEPIYISKMIRNRLAFINKGAIRF